MDLKKTQKSISRLLAWFGLNLCSLIIKIIPERRLYSFASGIAGLGFCLAVRQRRIAEDTLLIAFGQQKSSLQKERIIKDCFVNMAKSAVELMFMMDKPSLLKRRISIIGKDYLDKALLKGDGVILVSAHFGNFPLLLARLSLEGYKVAGIMRPMRDSRVEKIFVEKRKKFKVKTIYSQPRNVCVTDTIASLRNNEIVFIPIDQNFGTAGVFVDFFGKKAATATGPIIFAQRTKASVLPCFIIRQEDDSHKIIFEPAQELVEAKDPQETILLNIQKLTSIIEVYIRRYPAEWGWIHRRWKTKHN